MRYIKRFNESVSLNDRLESKLLSIGGDKVKFGLDSQEELLRMLDDGRLYNEEVIMIRHFANKKLFSNKCHRNVSDIYRNSKSGFKIVTGYALGEDNTWVCHSWGYDKGKVVETTGYDYKYYWGYELTPKESDEFCFNNY